MISLHENVKTTDVMISQEEKVKRLLNLICVGDMI